MQDNFLYPCLFITNDNRMLNGWVSRNTLKRNPNSGDKPFSVMIDSRHNIDPKKLLGIKDMLVPIVSTFKTVNYD